MDIWDVNKLLIFVIFVIPGFVSLKTYEILFLSLQKETANRIIDAVAYSCINYAVLFPLIYYFNELKLQLSHPIIFSLFCSFVLFIAPIIWVSLLKLIRGSKWLQRWLPHPTERTWDYIFGKKKPYWIILTLKSGNKIAGKFAYNSFASSGQSKEQIYIEETWLLNSDGGFERAKNSSAGTLIVNTDIESIELFNLIDEDCQ